MAISKKSKFFAASLSAAVTVSAVAPTILAAELPEDSQGLQDNEKEALALLMEAGVVKGDADTGAFRPGDSITRAEASVMLSAVLELDVDNAPAADFPDVDQDAWYAKYVNAVAAEGIVVGDKEGNFNWNDTLTRAEFAQMVFKAYGLDVSEAELPFEDLAEDAWYTDAIATLYADGLIAGQTDTTFGPNESIRRVDTARLLAVADLQHGTYLNSFVAPEEVTLEVDAIKVNKLEVKFNNAVDTEAYSLHLTKGTKDVEHAVEWNADNTVATITTTAKMTKGTYTVSLKDAEGEVASSASTEIVDQYVAEIKILNDAALTGTRNDLAPVLDSGEAYVYYDVLDQYGESLRMSTNIEWSSSVVVKQNDRATGKLTLTRSDDKAFTYSEKIYLTGVYTKTGVTVNQTVEVSAKQALDSIEVAGFVKKGTNEIVQTLPKGFKEGTYSMVFDVKDQNGNDMKAANITTSDVTFISDNVLLIKEFNIATPPTVTIDGKEYGAATVTPGMNVSTGGEVNITAIANKTGKKTELNTVVGEEQILTSFVMSAPEDMIADGESVEIPFTALDQNGEAITNFETLAKQSTFNKLSFTTSGGTLKLEQQDDGTAKLTYHDTEIQWKDQQSTDGIDRTVSLTSVVVGGDTSGQLLYIQDKARPDAIKSVDMDNILVEQGETKVQLKDITFLDQYGRTINDSTANGFFEASENGLLKGQEFAPYVYTVRAAVKGEDGFLEVNNNPSDPDVFIDVYEDKLNLVAEDKVVVSSKAGFSVNYEIARYKIGEGVDESQATSTKKSESVTVVDIKSVKGYSVADLNKFFVETDKSNDETGDTGTNKLENGTIGDGVALVNDGIADAYEQDIVVKGTFNGNEVNVPEVYLKVEAGKLNTANSVAGEVKITKADAAKIKWSDLYDATTARYIRKDATATIKVVINDLDATDVVDTVSKTVTISDEAAKASVIAVKDELTIKPDTTDIVSPAHASGIITINGNDYEVQDQYGVLFTAGSELFKVASVVENNEGYAENNFTVTGNNSSTATIAGAERGDTYVLNITVDDAKHDVVVTVGADEKANIIGSTNNYLDELIKNALEQQRKDGLN